MLRREGDGGAAEGVVEPGVLGVGRGEEAFQAQRSGDARDEGAGSVEEGKEAVPIDGEEKGTIGGEEGSAGRKRDGGVAETVDGDARDGVGVGEFGDEDKLVRLSRHEGVKEVCAKEGLEAAFDGHPDGLGLKEGLEGVAAGRVGEGIGQRADGGEERLMDARAVQEPGLRSDFSPRDLCPLAEDLRVGGVVVRDAPGEGVGNADEGVEDDKDRFKESAIGFHQRDAVGRIGKLFGLHERDDSRRRAGNME